MKKHLLLPIVVILLMSAKCKPENQGTNNNGTPAASNQFNCQTNTVTIDGESSSIHCEMNMDTATGNFTVAPPNAVTVPAGCKAGSILLNNGKFKGLLKMFQVDGIEKMIVQMDNGTYTCTLTKLEEVTCSQVGAVPSTATVNLKWTGKYAVDNVDNTVFIDSSKLQVSVPNWNGINLPGVVQGVFIGELKKDLHPRIDRMIASAMSAMRGTSLAANNNGRSGRWGELQ
jgi:hypothetical protein